MCVPCTRYEYTVYIISMYTVYICYSTVNTLHRLLFVNLNKCFLIKSLIKYFISNQTEYFHTDKNKQTNKKMLHQTYYEVNQSIKDLFHCENHILSVLCFILKVILVSLSQRYLRCHVMLMLSLPPDEWTLTLWGKSHHVVAMVSFPRTRKWLVKTYTSKIQMKHLSTVLIYYQTMFEIHTW